ncbi:hypothetical protein ID866_7574 [Astraeus odoratus]|nr:hypothetical protein ID866_7574 [Astraeus odoratus]
MISLPNGKTTTRIPLRDVLYVPEIGITLVSIGKLDAASYAALFRDKRCQIFDPRKKMGGIPLTQGLYCFKSLRRVFSGLAKTSETLTMEEIHARLGQIVPPDYSSYAKGWNDL